MSATSVPAVLQKVRWVDRLPRCREEKIGEEKNTGRSGSSSWGRSKMILVSHSQASKAAEERRCLGCHASGCRKHLGSEASLLDLSNASGILRLLRTFMLTVKTREFGVLIAGCMRVKHPNAEKGILAIVTPKPPSPWHPNGQPPPCSSRCLVALPSAAAAGAQWTRLDTLRSKKTPQGPSPHRGGVWDIRHGGR